MMGDQILCAWFDKATWAFWSLMKTASASFLNMLSGNTTTTYQGDSSLRIMVKSVVTCTRESGVDDCGKRSTYLDKTFQNSLERMI